MVEGQFINGMLLPDSFNGEACKDEILKQAKKAITAIVNHDKDANKNKLFPEEDAGILVRFGMKRLRLEGGFSRAVVQFRNPECLIENTSICLILPDFDFKNSDRHDPDVDKNARRWADMLREKHDLTGKEITKIYTFIQLRRELLEPKDKLKFVNSYDVIMIQKEIHEPVTKFLGQPCFKSKKYPFRINARSTGFRDQVLKANAFGNFVCEPNQVHVQVRFGNTLQSKADLLENFEDALNKAAMFIPGGLFNVQVVRMQTADGLALPVYVDFGSADDVVVQEGAPRAEPLVDELSTLPEGLKVKVMPSGNVRVLTEDNDEPVFYPTVEDEWENYDDLKPTMTREKLVKKLLRQREHKRKRAERRAPLQPKAKKQKTVK